MMKSSNIRVSYIDSMLDEAGCVWSSFSKRRQVSVYAQTRTDEGGGAGSLGLHFLELFGTVLSAP